MLLLFLDMIDTPEDRGLFEDLYLEYNQYMFKVASYTLGDDKLAEDAVNEAFLRIAKNFEKFKANLPEVKYSSTIEDVSVEKLKKYKKDRITCPKTRSYVVIIIRRVALNMLTKRNRQNEVLIDDPSIIDTLSAGGREELSAEEEYDRKQQRDTVIDAIGELSDAVRETMYLSLVQQMSPEEIAYMTDTKVDTVYKRLQRGREMLADILKDRI